MRHMFQALQDRRMHIEAERITSTIQRQWQQLAPSGIGAREDVESMTGTARLSRLTAQRAMQLRDDISDMIGQEGLPLQVFLEHDCTVITWKPMTRGGV